MQLEVNITVTSEHYKEQWSVNTEVNSDAYSE